MHENTPRPGCPWCHAPECSPTCPGPTPAVPARIPFDLAAVTLARADRIEHDPATGAPYYRRRP